MTLPTYPAEDFNRGSQMLAQLGSFWFNIFEDREVLRNHLRASGNVHGQTYLDYLEAVASVSRFTVPVFHRENWYLLTIRQSEADSTASVYQTGDLVYGEQDGSVTGRPEGFVQTYAGTDRPDQVRVTLPDGLADIPRTIQNLTIYPSLILVNGADYEVDVLRRILIFRDDPFENDLIAKREIVDVSGNVTDTEIALWVYQGDFDLDHIYTHFGYALGVRMQSSQFYKDLLNAYWDMHIIGMSRAYLESFLSASTGGPIALDPVETVEVVRTEELSQLVVTSSRVYRVPLAANLLVAEGDTIYLGDPITDAFQVTELAGHDPDLSALPSLALGPEYLGNGYLAQLTFKNSLGVVSVMGTDSEGRTIVQLETSGYPQDIERFWALVHQRGVADGETLAQILDVRPNPTTEPTASNLPSQVNTLEFLLENVLKNNLFVIQLRVASFDSDAPGLSFMRLIRDVIPPQTTYVLFAQLDLGEESIDLSVEGGEDESGAAEDAATFRSTGRMEESYPGYDDEVVFVRHVALDCNN